MKQQTKLTSGQQHEVAQHTGGTQEKTFASPEELLRLDAAQTPVPTQIAERLNRSLASEVSPDPKKSSWLRRLFGGS